MLSLTILVLGSVYLYRLFVNIPEVSGKVLLYESRLGIGVLSASNNNSASSSPSALTCNSFAPSMNGLDQDRSLCLALLTGAVKQG